MALYDLTSAELVAGDPAQKFPGLTELGMSADEQAEIIAALTSAGVYSPLNPDALASVNVKAEITSDTVSGIFSDALIYTHLDNNYYEGVSVNLLANGPAGKVLATSDGGDRITSEGNGGVIISGSGMDLIEIRGSNNIVFGGSWGDDIHVVMGRDNEGYGGSGDDTMYLGMGSRGN